MVLKGVNWVHNDKIRSNGLERSQVGTLIIKLGQMVLKGVNWVQNQVIWSMIKNGSNGLERSQLGTQWYNLHN